MARNAPVFVLISAVILSVVSLNDATHPGNGTTASGRYFQGKKTASESLGMLKKNIRKSLEKEATKTLTNFSPPEFEAESGRFDNSTTRFEHSLSRRKRQGDSALDVVGQSVDANSAESGTRLKRGLRDVSRSRRKRSIFSFSLVKMFEFGPKHFFRRRRPNRPKYGPPPVVHHAPIHYHQDYHHEEPVVTYTIPQDPVPSYQTIPYHGQTKTQQLWNRVNHNVELARRLLLSDEVQSDKNAVRNLVINPNGVTCEDVCRPDGIGYGTIGICTEKYCTCDFQGWAFTRHDCPVDCVFDPARLICDYPSNVQLCNDDDLYEDYGNHVQYGWPSGGYTKK